MYDMDIEDVAQQAEDLGWDLRKSPQRDPEAIDYGRYALIEVEHGSAIHPHGPTSEYVLDLDDVREWLADA